MKYSLTFLFLLLIGSIYGQTRFSHILITNDDGIEDADRLIALAKAVSKSAERVSVIVSSSDQSGTSNYSALGKGKVILEITNEYVDQENNITIYTLPDNPADCVLIGLGGLFDGDRPDLVLSGINGGSNIGKGWFGSGTIGAVRTAAFLGVKGVAFSGFDDDVKESYIVIPDWINRFIASGILEMMENGDYLTVGFPQISLDKIKGIKITERKVSFDNPASINFVKIYGDEPSLKESKTFWLLDKYESSKGKGLDESALEEGYIVITAMTVNENNSFLMERLDTVKNMIPAFVSSR